MDFGLSFSYVFKDKDWFKKIAIPALCSLIPVVGQFVVSGWGLKATKNVIDGYQENALPELDFGADLGRGFMAAVITFIYSLPIILLSGLGGLLFSFSQEADQTVQTLMGIGGICFGLVGFVLGILIAFLSMAGIANYVAKGNFGAAFKFSEIFGLIKKSFVSWLLVLVGAMLAFGIIAPLGTIACGIGVLLTSVYGTAIYSHLLGQAYNQSAKPSVVDVEPL